MAEIENPETENYEKNPYTQYWSVDEILLKDHSEQVSFDLTSSFLRLELNSSMTDPFVYGNVQIEDYLDIIGGLSIIGNETVEITISSVEGKTYKKKFKLMKVNPPLKSPVKTQKFYLLEFISVMGYNNLIRKFSKSFVNMKSTSIVKQIFNDYLYDEEDETPINTDGGEPDRTTSLVVPYMNPIDAISFLSLYSSYDNNYDFVYYEDFDQFNFISMSFLKSTNPVSSFYTSNDPEGRSDNEDGEKDIEYMRNRILSYSVGGDMYDVYKNIKTGTYAATNINFDMTLKKVTNRLYSYHKEFDRTDHIEPNPIVSAVVGNESSRENTSRIVITNEPTVTFDNNTRSQNILDSYYKRQSINNVFKQVITIKMHSRADLYPGQIVELEIKSNKMNDSSGDYTDKYLSGRYMVLNSAHFFERSKSTSAFILGRDSVPAPISSSVEIKEDSAT